MTNPCGLYVGGRAHLIPLHTCAGARPQAEAHAMPVDTLFGVLREKKNGMAKRKLWYGCESGSEAR